MLHEEVEKYINLSGDKEAWQNTSISRIGGYLDGYDKGLEVLDKIRSEMLEEMLSHSGTGEEVIQAYADGLKKGLAILDKYKAESEKMSKHWIDDADHWICPDCGFITSNPNRYAGCKCPKCGFQDEKDKAETEAEDGNVD